MPAAIGARRFFVLVPSDERKGDIPYFKAIEDQLDAGGYEAMLHDLLNYDLTGFVVRTAPDSEGLQEQKKLSMKTEEKWWMDVLQRGYVYNSTLGLSDLFGKWTCEVPTALLYDSYLAFAKGRDRYPLSRETLGRFIMKVAIKHGRCAGEVEVGEEMRDVLDDSGYTRRQAMPIIRERPWGYRLGTLGEARIKFAGVTGLTFEWVDGGDSEEGDDLDEERADLAAREAAVTAREAAVTQVEEGMIPGFDKYGRHNARF